MNENKRFPEGNRFEFRLDYSQCAALFGVPTCSVNAVREVRRIRLDVLEAIGAVFPHEEIVLTVRRKQER